MAIEQQVDTSVKPAPPDSHPEKTNGETGKVYTAEEVKQKLRGQGTALKEREAMIAQLTERLNAFESAESERAKKREAEERKTLEAKGEYEKILAERESKLAELETGSKGLAERVARYDETITGMIIERLEGVSDEHKETIAQLLAGKDPLDQLQLVPKLLDMVTAKSTNAPTPDRARGAVGLDPSAKLADQRRLAQLKVTNPREFARIMRERGK